MDEHSPSRLSRRSFLSSVAISALAGTTSTALARTFSGVLPWAANDSEPPVPVLPGSWQFFTPDEAMTVEAIVDCLIPADDLSIGGKEAGCAVYIDRQLAGSYGNSSRLYTKGPFMKGLPTQGYQDEATPAGIYRRGINAINTYLKTNSGGKVFSELPAAEKDSFLKDLEADKIKLSNDVDGRAFFGVILNNAMEGFFADPVYGGNKDMVSWRMLGFPGARYDYRDHVSKHNEPYPLPPVSIAGAPEWLEK